MDGMRQADAFYAQALPRRLVYRHNNHPYSPVQQLRCPRRCCLETCGCVSFQITHAHTQKRDELQKVAEELAKKQHDYKQKLGNADVRQHVQ